MAEHQPKPADKANEQQPQQRPQQARPSVQGQPHAREDTPPASPTAEQRHAAERERATQPDDNPAKAQATLGADPDTTDAGTAGPQSGEGQSYEQTLVAAGQRGERTEQQGPLQSAGPVNPEPTAEAASDGVPHTRPLRQPDDTSPRDAQHVRPDMVGSQNRNPVQSPSVTQAASPAMGPGPRGVVDTSQLGQIRTIAADALRGQDPSGMANPWQQALRRILAIAG